ncbi:enoyl-CoA hydratase-related protein [Mesorhizobium sp. B2-8-5]|uniref:enoyl-CoA hydratase-related protein n=1 Tax=Mesorhizobium sp. B2-8-5 TaxID=2589903 RepID=UPI001127842C|nr:enoyl-CoA hydratase-related protein [Mesorhizobium sp. B2-8-5]UCI28660.1 enoyl-CoA hydratase/isomerase family protein [Mesorhizobium sp. B2-8-5]
MSSTNDQSLVVIESRPVENVGLVEINRPEARNALNLEVREKLATAVAGFSEDPEVRAIVIAGRGGNFVAGADIKAFEKLGSADMLLQRTHRYWDVIARCPKPVIAAVEGFALGGGCELAMHADIIVAARTATFGQSEVKLGLMPGAGGTQRLLRAIGKYKTLMLVLTGDMFSAERAGLVSTLTDEGQALQQALQIAQKISRLPPLAVEQIKEAVVNGEDAPLETALRLERKAFQLLFDTADKREGIGAFIDKRKPSFKGR